MAGLNKKLLSPVNNPINQLGYSLKVPLLLLCQSIQVSLGISRHDSRSTVRHLGITLGIELVPGLGMTVMEILLDLSHGKSALADLVHQRLKLVLQKVGRLSSGTPVIKLLLEIRVPLVRNGLARLLDLVNHPLGIDHLVLQGVDDIIHLGVIGTAPASLGHGLTKDVLTDVGQSCWPSPGSHDVVRKGVNSHWLGLVLHQLIEDFMERVFVIKPKHILQGLKKLLDRLNKPVPCSAKLC